jgi:hypothetical protein
MKSFCKQQYLAVVYGLKEALHDKTISLQQYIELVDLAYSPKEVVAKIVSYGLVFILPNAQWKSVEDVMRNATGVLTSGYIQVVDQGKDCCGVAQAANNPIIP